MLNEQQFKQIKSELDSLQQFFYTQLAPLGFNRVEGPPDWLGFTIRKKEGEQLTIVGFALSGERPVEFRLTAKKWQVPKPAQTSIDLYRKSFSSVKEVRVNLKTELMVLKEKLESVR